MEQPRTRVLTSALDKGNRTAATSLREIFPRQCSRVYEDLRI